MKQISLRTLSAIAWLFLSLSLGGWWTVMGIRTAGDIARLKSELGLEKFENVKEDLERKQRMIKLEGISFLFLISIGGLTIIFMSIRDERKNKILKEFFATVTHEMKTPLASLRLQAESLADMIQSKKHSILLDRLIADTERVEMQMEKALYLASISREESLFMENITLKDLLHPILSYYENIQTECSHLEYFIKCDKRAFESILKNLVENSLNHGKANKIFITSKEINKFIQLTISDNGKGFSGKVSRLGELYYKHTNKSGSGIGLYITKNLMEKMEGKVEFTNPENKFTVNLFFTKA